MIIVCKPSSRYAVKYPLIRHYWFSKKCRINGNVGLTGVGLKGIFILDNCNNFSRCRINGIPIKEHVLRDLSSRFDAYLSYFSQSYVNFYEPDCFSGLSADWDSGPDFKNFRWDFWTGLGKFSGPEIRTGIRSGLPGPSILQ